MRYDSWHGDEAEQRRVKQRQIIENNTDARMHNRLDEEDKRNEDHD